MSHETLIDRYMRAREIKSNQTIKWQQDVQQCDNHCSLPEGRRCRLLGTIAWGLTFSWRLRFLYFYFLVRHSYVTPCLILHPWETGLVANLPRYTAQGDVANVPFPLNLQTSTTAFSQPAATVAPWRSRASARAAAHWR